MQLTTKKRIKSISSPYQAHNDDADNHWHGVGHTFIQTFRHVEDVDEAKSNLIKFSAFFTLSEVRIDVKVLLNEACEDVDVEIYKINIKAKLVDDHADDYSAKEFCE